MIEMEVSSGNVFADMGMPNPEERLMRSQIVHEIHTRLKARKLSARAAAQVLDVPVEIARQFLKARFVDLPLEQLLVILKRLNLTAVLNFQSLNEEPPKKRDWMRGGGFAIESKGLDDDLVFAVSEAVQRVLREHKVTGKGRQ